MALLALRRNRLTDSDLDFKWKLSGKSTKLLERQSSPVGLCFCKLRAKPNKKSSSAPNHYVFVNTFYHGVVMAFW